MKKFIKPLLTVLLFVFIAIVLAVSVKGVHSNVTLENIKNQEWKDGPFELSPERGRFALAMSVAETGSFQFPIPVAQFATPDVGVLENGKFVSLFAPAVSFIVIPGYLIGKAFGANQFGAFASIAVFALINAIVLRLVARKIGASNLAANISALLFVLATPAFAYGTTLYQHHVSTFLILTTLYVLLKWKNIWSLFVVWFLFACSIPVDYPNLFLMLPLALYATGRIIWVKKDLNTVEIKLNFIRALTPFIMILPLLFYVWFSLNSYNKPFQLSGTVKSADVVTDEGKVEQTEIVKNTVSELQAEYKKSAVGFFQTRNLLNGFFIHIFSQDRGIIMYAPIVLFGILGALSLWKKNQTAVTLISAIILANVLLYSMWGDPWGGWAFGSRYLIPSYAMLSVLAAIGLTNFRRNKLFLVLFTLIGIYSIAVNTLGALTSSANPPKIQVLSLEEQTGQVQRYTYQRNMDNLLSNGSKSFVFDGFLDKNMTGIQFYIILTVAISIVFLAMLVLLII